MKPSLKVSERDYISGITLEEPSSAPEIFALTTEVEIPCPIEQKVNQIIVKHNLDTDNHKIATVLDVIRQIRSRPQLGFIEALTDNQIKNIQKRRWHVYPGLNGESPKP